MLNELIHDLWKFYLFNLIKFQKFTNCSEG